MSQTAPNPMLSTIRYFREEYDEHIRDHYCRAGVCSALFVAPCVNACPAHVDVPAYLSLVAAGRPLDAYRLIRQENPKMEEDLIAYGVKSMKQINLLGSGDAATQGIGIMTEARWKQTYDLMLTSGLLKPIPNWQQAFTTQFVKDLKIMP